MKSENLKRLKQSELCELLDISFMTINRWGKDGCPRNQDSRKTYDLSKVVAWCAKRSAEKNSVSEDGVDWQKKLTKEKALMAEIDRLRAEESVVDAGWVDHWTAEVLSGAKETLLAIPDRLAGPLALISDYHEVKVAIHKEICNALETLKRSLEARIKGPKPIQYETDEG